MLVDERSPLEKLVAYLEELQKRFEDLDYLDLYGMSIATRRFAFQIMPEEQQNTIRRELNNHIIYTISVFKRDESEDVDARLTAEERKKLFSRMNGMRNMATHLSEWYRLPKEE